MASSGQEHQYKKSLELHVPHAGNILPEKGHCLQMAKPTEPPRDLVEIMRPLVIALLREYQPLLHFFTAKYGLTDVSTGGALS